MSYAIDAIRQSFGRHAPAYDAHAKLQQSVLEQGVKLLAPYLKAGGSLLDAGCGTGYLTHVLQARKLPQSVIGCDIAHGMCVQAAKRGEALINCASIEQLPLADASVDAAFSSLTFQWLNAPERALQEIARVLKPGGRALIATFGPGTLQELREAFATVDDVPHVSEFISIKEFNNALLDIDIEILNSIKEFTPKYYKNVRTLMQEIRDIGAANKREERRKTFTGRARFAAMQRYYCDRYETPRGIPATWEILYLLLQKKEA